MEHIALPSRNSSQELKFLAVPMSERFFWAADVCQVFVATIFKGVWQDGQWYGKSFHVLSQTISLICMKSGNKLPCAKVLANSTILLMRTFGNQEHPRTMPKIRKTQEPMRVPRKNSRSTMQNHSTDCNDIEMCQDECYLVKITAT